MKKSLLFILTLTFVFTLRLVEAQQVNGHPQVYRKKCELPVREKVKVQGKKQPEKAGGSYKTEAAAAVDTAGIEFMQDGIAVYYDTTEVILDYGGGHKVDTFLVAEFPCFGTSWDNNKAFAQMYPYVGDGLNVTQVLFRFNEKFPAPNQYNNGDTHDLKVNVYDGTDEDPGEILGTTSLPYNDIDTNGNYSVATFSSPVHITNAFAVGLDLTPMFYFHGEFGDTTIFKDYYFTLYSTRDNQPHGSYNARVYADFGGGYVWYRVKDVYGSELAKGNVNLVMLPVLDEVYTPVGIEEAREFNGIKMVHCYPNPTREYASIEYEIRKASDINIELIDVTGKIVLSQPEGMQSAGRHQLQLNVSGLVPGSYFYSLISNEGRLTKKITIE